MNTCFSFQYIFHCRSQKTWVIPITMQVSVSTLCLCLWVWASFFINCELAKLNDFKLYVHLVSWCDLLNCYFKQNWSTGSILFGVSINTDRKVTKQIQGQPNSHCARWTITLKTWRFINKYERKPEIVSVNMHLEMSWRSCWLLDFAKKTSLKFKLRTF